MGVVGTKTCPLCAEAIDLGATVCPHCGARFEVSARGYCASCHQVVPSGVGGVCSVCGGPLIDETLESHFVGEGPPPGAVAVVTAPAVGGAVPAAGAPGPPSGIAEVPPPPPPPPERVKGEGRRWLPWAIAAVVVVAAGGGVLAWWLTKGNGEGGGIPVGASLGGYTASTTSVPAEEIDALSAYLVAVLEAEAPVGEASAAANTIATTQQAASAQRDLADAFQVCGDQVAQLDPPPSAREDQGLIVQMAADAVDLYRRVADAVESGDTSALLAMQSDLVDWMALAVQEATERELLINTALAAEAEVPLNRYLLDTGAVRTAVFGDLQTFLEEVQTDLTAGRWQATVQLIGEEIGIIDGFLADWEQLTPPPEAAAYHTAQGEAVRTVNQGLTDLQSALESQDISGLQTALLSITREVGQAQEVLLQRSQLIIQALSA
jgi:hypothetical protein